MNRQEQQRLAKLNHKNRSNKNHMRIEASFGSELTESTAHQEMNHDLQAIKSNKHPFSAEPLILVSSPPNNTMPPKIIDQDVAAKFRRRKIDHYDMNLPQIKTPQANNQASHYIHQMMQIESSNMPIIQT